MGNAEQKLRVQHFSVVQQAGEFQLPQGFKYRDGHGIAQVETSGLAPHRDTDTGFPVRFQKILGKPLGLFSEEQVILIPEIGLRVAPGRLCGKAPHPVYFISMKEIG